MKSQLLRIATATLSAAVLVGCATQGATQPRSADAGLPGKPGCFFLRSFDGSWTVLDKDELIVYAPLYSNPYLVKLFEPVPTLPFAEHLGFEDSSHSGEVCNNNLDDLVVPNWQPHRIPIVAVHQLTVAQANTLLQQHGLKPVPSRSASANH